MKNTAPILTLLATLAFLVSPFLTSPFSGYDPAGFPVAQVDPPVQPAGYAFSIWGVIYLWLLVMAFYGLLRRRESPDWQDVQIPLILSLGPGALWLWLANQAPVAATVLIFWMLAFALLAVWRLPRKDRWLLQAPVALYAGWLTAAAHVSLGVVIGGYGIATPDWAAVIVLAMAVIIATAMLLSRPEVPEYGLAVLWALVGILVANTTGSNLVFGATLIGFLLLGAIMSRGLVAGYRKSRLKHPQ